MKIFYINADIDAQLLELFITFSNQYNDQPWQIILNTEGGCMATADIIIHQLNEHSKKLHTEIILIKGVSAGFMIFAEARCTKLVAASAYMMWHYAAINITINHNGNPYYAYDVMRKKSIQDTRRRCELLATKYLTEKQLKSYKRGNFIYLDHIEILQQIPDAIAIEHYEQTIDPKESIYSKADKLFTK